jgi:hypothetical protein
VDSLHEELRGRGAIITQPPPQCSLRPPRAGG